MREEKIPNNAAEVCMLKPNIVRKRGGKPLCRKGQLCREGPWGATVQAPLIVAYGVFQFFRACMQFSLATKLKQELTQVIGLELKPVQSSCPTQSCSSFILGYFLYSWNWSEKKAAWGIIDTCTVQGKLDANLFRPDRHHCTRLLLYMTSESCIVSWMWTHS